MGELRRVVVAGAGLIGTSIALALRERGIEVTLTDRDPAAVRLAEELGAGTRWRGRGPADLAVLAVPPGALPAMLRQAQQEAFATSYTDVASVKVQPLTRAAALGCDLSSFVGGHPVAGRERSGPAAARADLFLGRPWVLCPPPQPSPTREDAVANATALVRACGGEPVTMAPEAHDRAVALVSHVPHVLAAAAAARLRDADTEALRLTGQGLRDTTRIAAGDPDLWAAILSANAGPVADILDEVAGELGDFIARLRSLAAPRESGADSGASTGGTDDLMRRGQEGRGRIPGKRGGPAHAYAVLPVVLPDRPGELGRLLTAAGEAGVNVEDIALEHSPGLPVGVAELSVQPGQVAALAQRLRAAGWSVQG